MSEVTTVIAVIGGVIGIVGTVAAIYHNAQKARLEIQKTKLEIEALRVGAVHTQEAAANKIKFPIENTKEIEGVPSERVKIAEVTDETYEPLDEETGYPKTFEDFLRRKKPDFMLSGGGKKSWVLKD